MRTPLHRAAAPHLPAASAARSPVDLDAQRLRILRCTAHAMATSPGGLRFKAGARPWLEGLATNAQRTSTQRTNTPRTVNLGMHNPLAQPSRRPVTPH